MIWHLINQNQEAGTKKMPEAKLSPSFFLQTIFDPILILKIAQSLYLLKTVYSEPEPPSPRISTHWRRNLIAKVVNWLFKSNYWKRPNFPLVHWASGG